MESVPEVSKCFGMFPPKVAVYFISLFGLGSGGVGLAGIVLYGLVEDSEIARFFTDYPADENVKKLVLITLGLSSLMLFISSFFLFMGSLLRQDKALVLGAWFLCFLCSLLIIGAISLPLMCFFYQKTCVLKKLSSFLLTFGYMFITVFLWIWLYFLAVIFNHLNNLGI